MATAQSVLKKIEEAERTRATHLNLSFKQLTDVPESITRLTNLTNLDLSYNQLTALPESITRLTNLTNLDLNSNQLTEVPESITRLTNLTSLSLNSNQLTALPESITRLTNLTNLDLDGNQLTALPESITRLTNLTYLDLNSNQLTALPESIARLTNLTNLSLRGNQLTALPESIIRLTNLTYLDLNSNQLTALPESITRLTNLTNLSLRGNQLTALPESITRLTNLTYLDLNSNQLTALPESITRLTNLTNLDLDGNQLTALPESIARLTNLTNLSLRGNQLTALPESITRLTNLTYLDLDGNQLTALPESIARLTNLTNLSLRGNQLTALPESIIRLTNLTYLDLNSNQLTALPESITRLTNLTNLSLRGNQLTALPESITRLTNLTYLDLNSNQLTALPESITRLTNLTNLSLRGNQLTALPESITRLTNLTSLSLRGNQLTALPESITRLTNLTSLSLNSNQLTALPESITRLTNLTSLDLNSNQLTEVPESITRLTNLTSLDLNSNQLTALPESITRLTNLTYLDLRGNQLNLPPEIIVSPFYPARILDYLRQLQQSPTSNRPVNEAKVILVGEATVGKTSLVKRLTGKKFDPDEKKTDGIDIHRWDLEGIHCTETGGGRDGNSRTVRLNVWDLGGQEIYHATHQFFLTERTLYLIVLSARLTDEQNRLHYWLKTVRALGKDAPILIVHNHYEENPEQLDRKTLQEKYPTIAGFIETSCPDATLKGIDTLKDAIRREIGGMRHVADKLPPAYFVVKERLEKETQKRDFISSEQYERICVTAGVTDTAERIDILKLLHALGTVLSFPDLRLQDTKVLNPEWVTEGVYSVLDDPALKAAGDGILRTDALSAIFGKAKKRYPVSKHSFIVEMMLRFELCFERPGVRGEYLVPELLTPIEPDDIGDFRDGLRFELQYEFLPRSILPRFIVRTSYMLQPYRWRNGVVIEQPNNRALIRADVETNTVTISVTGNKNTWRDLLSVVRDHFVQIHQSPETLTVEEQIPLTDYSEAKPVPYQFLRQLEDDSEKEFRWPEVPVKLSVSQLLTGIERRRPEDRKEKRFREENEKPFREEQTVEKPTPPASVPVPPAVPVPPTTIPHADLLERTAILDIAPDNARYLDELADKVGTGRIVPFVGAGMTIPLKMLGWKDALKQIYTDAVPSLKPADILSYGIAIGKDDLEGAAQALWDAEGLGAKWFNDRIKSLFGRNKLKPPITGALTYLPQIAPGPILTTNFDAALEQVYADAGQPFAHDETVLGAYRADGIITHWDEGRRFLLKLHGDADESSGRVLTRAQYDHAYNKSSKLPELLRALFGSRRPLLFLGCSLLKDRTLTELQNAGLQQSNAYHFALLEIPESETERQKRQTDLIQQYGIQPIWFAKGDFAAIERVLEFLASVRPVRV